MPEFVKVDHNQLCTEEIDAKLKTRLSKSSPFEVKMLVEFIRRGISGVATEKHIDPWTTIPGRVLSNWIVPGMH